MSLSGKDYTMPSPFKNPTSYKVGQIRTINSEQFIVTAIVRVTDREFKIYGIPPNPDLRLKEYHDFQSRREKGQIKVYTPGKVMLTIQL